MFMAYFCQSYCRLWVVATIDCRNAQQYIVRFQENQYRYNAMLKGDFLLIFDLGHPTVDWQPTVAAMPIYSTLFAEIWKRMKEIRTSNLSAFLNFCVLSFRNQGNSTGNKILWTYLQELVKCSTQDKRGTTKEHLLLLSAKSLLFFGLCVCDIRWPLKSGKLLIQNSLLESHKVKKFLREDPQTLLEENMFGGPYVTFSYRYILLPVIHSWKTSRIVT